MPGWSLAAVSCHALYHQLWILWLSKTPYDGDVCFLHRTQALTTCFLSVKPYISCLLAGKCPLHAAAPQSSHLQTQTPGVGETNSVYAVNFTSLGFVSLVCNMGKCEKKKQVFTSLVLCTRRRKLEPGLTICRIIKTAFVPAWFTLFAFSLFFSLLSFLLNFASLVVTFVATILPVVSVLCCNLQFG